MATINVYDSEGHKFEAGEKTSSTDDTIKDYFLSRVRLWVQSSRGSHKVICFFRARDTSSSRAEQYYAIYQTSRSQSLFRDFIRDLESTVEDDWGMDVVTGPDDTEVYRQLTQVSSGSPSQFAGDEFQHEVIQDRLRTGEHLMFGVPNVRAGIGLVRSYTDDNNSISVGIAEETQSSVQQHTDLLFVPDGRYSSLAPLEGTEQVMRDGREALESKLVQRNVSTIEENVRQLREETSLSDSRIREVTHGSVPVLEQPRSRTTPGNPRSSSRNDGGNRTSLLAAGGLVFLVFLLVGGITLLGMGPIAGYLDGGGGSGVEQRFVDVDSGAIIVDVADVNGSANVTVEGKRSGVNFSDSTDVNDTEYRSRSLPSDVYNVSVTGPGTTDIDEAVRNVTRPVLTEPTVNVSTNSSATGSTLELSISESYVDNGTATLEALNGTNSTDPRSMDFDGLAENGSDTIVYDDVDDGSYKYTVELRLDDLDESVAMEENVSVG